MRGVCVEVMRGVCVAHAECDPFFFLGGPPALLFPAFDGVAVGGMIARLFVCALCLCVSTAPRCAQAYDDLSLLSVLAVAVFAFRRTEILSCTDRNDLPRIFLGGGMGGGVVHSSLKTLTLLSHFLFL
jgi:hypothetical protein